MRLYSEERKRVELLFDICRQRLGGASPYVSFVDVVLVLMPDWNANATAECLRMAY